MLPIVWVFFNERVFHASYPVQFFASFELKGYFLKMFVITKIFRYIFKRPFQV